MVFLSSCLHFKIISLSLCLIIFFSKDILSLTIQKVSKEKLLTISKEAPYNQGWTRISTTSIWFGILKNWNICFLPHKKDWMHAQKSALVASAPCASTELGESASISENTEDDPFRLFLYTNGFAFQRQNQGTMLCDRARVWKYSKQRSLFTNRLF